MPMSLATYAVIRGIVICFAVTAIHLLRGGRSVRWRAAPAEQVGAFRQTPLLGSGLWLRQMERCAPGRAVMRPNNSLQRTIGHRGPRLAAARPPCLAAQLGR